MSRKVSLKDIAKEAGVSTALVSYVLNNLKEGRIRKEVAQRVREVARRLNYRPNHLARSLKTRKTMTIGLVVADISNPFSSALARIIEDEAEKKNYTVIFGSSDENAAKCGKLINTFLDRQVDGLILSPPAGAGQQVKELIEQEVPVVLLDRYFEEFQCACVMVDNIDASAMGVNHLFSLGRKKIAYLGYNSEMLHLREREQGYIEALLANADAQSPLVRRVNIANDPQEILAALHELLDMHPDGFVFASNMIATICLKKLYELPLRIPDDLSLVCFDETSSLQLFHAPVAFIRQPLQTMGRLAADMLIAHLQGVENSQKTLLKADLIIKN